MNVPIKNRLDENIDYTFTPGINTSENSTWLVILGHGVTGNKDRPVVADTASALSQAGFDTLRFSFSGNGKSGGAFADATISKEADDLEAVLDVVSGKYPHIAYIGHSMGAAVGVIQAAKDRRIQALVSLAGMVDTQTFAKTEFGEAIPGQSLLWDEPGCPLSSQFIEDLCQTIRSTLPHAAKIVVPWLLVHGTADDVVSPADTASVQSRKGDTVQVVSIEGADHSFSEAPHKAEMTQAVLEWMQSLIARMASSHR